MICCCAVVRNVAYYKEGWFAGMPSFNSNIERTINGNFMDMAVLEWCKLFGDPRHEPQHWQRVILCREQRQQFKHELVQVVGHSKRDWNALRTICLEFRNDFVAHLGSEPIMRTPPVDPVWKSTAYYYDFIRRNEMPTAEPADINSYYNECAKAGREYYSRVQDPFSA